MRWGNGERAQRWEEQSDAPREPPPSRPPRPPPRRRRGGPARAPTGAGRRDALVISHGGCGDGRCGATAAVLGDGICGATTVTLLLFHVGRSPWEPASGLHHRHGLPLHSCWEFARGSPATCGGEKKNCREGAPRGVDRVLRSATSV